MKPIIMILLFIIFSQNLYAVNTKKVYFAGGCFWCMEESFDKVEGVIKTISGYSGGHIKNPKYKDVIKNTTGHYETLEITYDPIKIKYEKLLEIYWVNVDPFDAEGQFCDKGESYKSVIFYNNDNQKKIIQNSIKKLKISLIKKLLPMLKILKNFI